MAIVLKTISDSAAAQKDLGKLRESVNKIQVDTEKATRGFSNFSKAIVAGFVAVSSFKEFFRVSDELTNMENKLKSVTDTQNEFNVALFETQKIAIQTRTDLSSTANLYSKLSLAAKSFGLNQKDVGKVTKFVNEAIIRSGASAAESRSTILQLGQAIGSGVLQGDELRALRENSIILVKELAAGMNVPIAALKKMGEEGLLTTDVIVKALVKQADKAGESFGKLGVTFEQAFTNLNTAFFITFSSIKKIIFNTNTSIAEIINNIAEKIFDFAINLEFIILRLRIKMASFVFYLRNLFDSFAKSLEDRFGKTEEIVEKIRVFFSDVFSSIKSSMLIAFSTIYVLISKGFTKLSTTPFEVLIKEIISKIKVLVREVFDEIQNYFNNSSLETIFKNFINVFDKFKTNAISAFNFIKTFLRDMFSSKLDINKFIPDLNKALVTVKQWVYAIEYWFMWLYDKVIGHSWIPDLVTDVGNWLKKLNGTPLKSIQSFSINSSKIFKGIKISTPFVSGSLSLTIFHGVLGKLLITLGTLVSVFMLLNTLSKTFHKNVNESKDKFLSKEYFKNIEDRIKDVKTSFSKDEPLQTKESKDFKTKFHESTLVRIYKQLAGIQDKYPGTLFGQQVDTNAKVALGVHRKKEERPFLADTIALIPEKLKIPIIAVVTGAITLALINAFKNASSPIIGIMTTVFGVVVAANVSDSEISRVISTVVSKSLELINITIKKILSKENVLFDPVGFIALIVKLSFLFKAGREFFLTMAKNILVSPTRGAGLVVQQLKLNQLLRDRVKLQDKLKRVGDIGDFENRLNQSTQAYKVAVKDLANLPTTIGGPRLGIKGAQDAIKYSGANQFSNAAANSALNAAKIAADTRIKASENLKELKKQKAELNERILQAKGAEDNLRGQLVNLKSQSSQAFINTVGGIGGILGGVGGAQLGAEIAKGFEDRPWVQVGITMAGGFVGQAFGAATGNLLAIMFQWALTKAWLYAVIKPFGRFFIYIAEAALIKPLVTRMIAAGWITGIKAGGAFITIAALAGVLIGAAFVALIKTYFSKPIKAAIDWTTGNDKSGKNVFEKMLDWNPWEKRAEGGILRGAGNGTSDSVPVMASNGEFIVNAKSTKKHRGLLEAINDGSLPKFSQGGIIQTLPEITVKGSIVNTKDSQKSINITNAIKNTVTLPVANSSKKEENGFIENFKEVLMSIVEPFKNVTDKLLGNLFPEAFGSKEDKGIQDILESVKTIPEATKVIAANLEKFGIKGITSTELESSDYSTLEQIASTLDDLRRLQPKVGDSAANQLRFKSFTNDLRSLIKNRLVESTGDVSATIPGETTSFTFKDAFDAISKVLPGLNLSLESFKKLNDETRNKLSETAKGLAILTEKLDTTSLPAEKLTERFKNLETQTKSLEKEFEAKLRSVLTEYDINVKKFDKLGLNISREAFNLIRTNSQQEFNKLIAELELVMSNILSADSSTTATAIAIAEQRAYKIREQIELLSRVAIGNIGGSFGKLASSLELFNLNLNKHTYNLLKETDKRTLEAYSKALLDNAKRLNDDTLTSSQKRELEKAQHELGKAASRIIEKNSLDYKSIAVQAGEAFANSITSSMSDGLKSVLKGQKSIKGMFNSILSDITNNIIDIFVDGLMDPLVSAREGEEGLLFKIFSGLGRNLFGITPKATEKVPSVPGFGDMVKSGISTPGFGDGIFGAGEENPLLTVTEDQTNTLVNSLVSVQGSITSGNDKVAGFWGRLFGFVGTIISSLAALITGMATKAASGIGKGFLKIGAMFGGGAATGGLIKGLGTGTSDSNLIRVSTGEFIVNAKATKNNLKLLTTLNSGKLKKFATGGLIASSMLATPSMANISSQSGKSNNSQVVNINITGDISRQTKAEIYRMLPSITDGVNMNNRERGYKG